MKKWLILAAIAGGPLFAQQVSPPPDCVVQFSFTSTGGTTVPFSNRFIGCQNWYVGYSTYNTSGLSLTVQSAPDAGGTPGAFVSFIGPETALPYGSGNATGTFVPWVQITETATFTAGGFINGTLIGWKPGRNSGGNGGGGGGSGSSYGPVAV